MKRCVRGETGWQRSTSRPNVVSGWENGKGPRGQGCGTIEMGILHPLRHENVLVVVSVNDAVGVKGDVEARKETGVVRQFKKRDRFAAGTDRLERLPQVEVIAAFIENERGISRRIRRITPGIMGENIYRQGDSGFEIFRGSEEGGSQAPSTTSTIVTTRPCDPRKNICKRHCFPQKQIRIGNGPRAFPDVEN